jgi:hypothetical protein
MAGRKIFYQGLVFSNNFASTVSCGTRALGATLLNHSRIRRSGNSIDADLIIGLCKKWSVHRHVSIVFSPNQPIAVCWFNYPVVIRARILSRQRGNCRRGRTKCRGSLRQRRQFFAVYSAIFILFTVHYYFDT